MRSDKGHADGADDADLDLFGLGFCRFREILLMTCRILCFILGGFEEKAYFCGRVKRLKGEDYGIRDKKHSCFDR